VSTELPQGWIEATIEEINLHISKNITPSDFPDEEFELFSVPIFPTGKPENVYGRDIGSSKQIVSTGDVLLCKINPRINRVWTVGKKTNLRQIASSEWINVRNPVLCSNYLKYAFSKKDFRALLCSEVSGVGGSLTRAQPKKVEKYSIPLAPLNEQIRIADKLDSMLAKVDAAQARLEKIPTLLKRFRQSVLAAAVSGKLTEEWREGKKLNATIIKHNKKLEPIGDNENYFDAPSSWSWSRLGSVVRLINGDRGKNYPNQSEYVEDGIPFINTGHIEPNGTLSAERMNFITKEKYDSLGSGKIINNDLVYCLRGATMGKTARVTPFDTGAIASSLVIVRPETLLLTNYCFYFLISPEARKLIKLFDNGSAQPNLSAKSLSMYPIALPSLYEQKEIVRRVESLFTLADTVEKQYLETKKRIDRLTQSLLAKAFRGELVPQDPNDEPAAELLKRIQAERQAQAPAKRNRKQPA
jgi:type I restriction enzyme S subunit